jgi:hypothetical protein
MRKPSVLLAWRAVSPDGDCVTEQTAQVDLDTPLRLARAVELAFPFGGMTVSGLRKERDRKRLVIEKIAGKEFTTLRYIEQMRVKCREAPREQDCGLSRKSVTGREGSHGAQPGSLEMDRVRSARAALEMTARGLISRSLNTSPKNIQSRESADVILLKS